MNKKYHKHKSELPVFAAKKSFGQNFLTDPSYLNEIVSVITSNITDKNVFEIGTGTGALTRRLLDIAETKNVTIRTIELEQDTILYLKSTPLAFNKHVNLLEGDFLKLKPEEYLANCNIVVGNIPYYITSQIIDKILDDNAALGYPLDKVYLMMQQEVAERLVAQPHTKAYSKLTVFSRLRSDIEIVINKIPPSAFKPSPSVYSAFVEFSPYRDNHYGVKDEKNFSRLVRIAFSQKRRTLRNCLIGGQIPVETIDKIYAELDLHPNTRAEELPIEVLVKISEMI